MRKIKIITDSCSDLTEELMKMYNIDYARMNTVFEGVESPALLTWTNEDAHKLYDLMRNGNRVTTTQVPVEEFTRIFTYYLDEGYDIVYIGCSTKQSGSVNTGAVVAKKLLANYADAKIYCIDSLNACIGEGILAIEAAKQVEAGKTIDEVKDYVLSNRKKVLEFVTVHTLDYLKKAGRVKASAAFFGNLMGVKPILIADAEGNQAAFKKVKGRQTSFKEIVSLMKENIIDAENQTIYLVHADCSQDEINALTALVKQEIPCKNIYTLVIGPIIGASVGPDTIGIFAMGKDVTFVGGE